MWVMQFSRDRGRGSIDEARRGEAADNQAETRWSENHVNVLN